MLGVFTLALATLLAAQPPAWWSNSSNPVVDPNATTTGVDQNYAPANLGQLKFFAKQAKLHLDASLYGGSGSAITSLVSGFTPQQGVSYTQAELDALRAANYAPINLGQLKAVAKPFYERLNAAGYDTKANLKARGYASSWEYVYPWNPTTPVAENYAPANIGQLKLVFSFDLNGFDTDLDGLPSAWELAHGFNPADSSDGSGTADADGDGLTNFQEFQQGSNPHDYYSQGAATITPVLSISSGNTQTGSPGEYLANPFVVEVRNGSSSGSVLANAPIVFEVTEGNGGVSHQSGGLNPASTVTVLTDTNGLARAWYKQGGQGGVGSKVRAKANQSQYVEFTSSTENVARLKVTPSQSSLVVLEGAEGQVPLTLTNESSGSVSFASDATGEIHLSSPLPHPGDQYGYRWASSDDAQGGVPYVWQDISQTGTRLNSASESDDGYEQVTIPFAFPFYGELFTEMYVSANGFITFGQGSGDYTPGSLPSLDEPSRLIAAFFRDLNPGSGGDIYYSANSEEMIVQYENVRAYGSDALCTFQIALRRSGEIILYYKDTGSLQDEAVVGIQNGAGDDGFSLGQSSINLRNEFAILISGSNQGWLTILPAEGVLAGGASSAISIKVSPPLGLPTGDYAGNIEIYDQNHSIQSALSSLTVTVKVPVSEGDSDGDGIPDAWELQNWNSLSFAGKDDPDQDGLNNAREYQLGTSPAGADTDGDGVLDGDEIAQGLNPLASDTDGDELSDGVELSIGTNPLSTDTDGDELPDGWEHEHGCNPLVDDASNDLDIDGYTNLQEFLGHTDPSDYYSQGGKTIVPVLRILAGNGQVGAMGAFLPHALEVKVTNAANGWPLTNAPVNFSANGTSGGIAVSMTGAVSGSLTVRTGGTGVAGVYQKLGDVSSAVTPVTATIPGRASVVFNNQAVSTSSIVGLWKMNEGSGVAVADSSSQPHNGAFQGTPEWITRYGGLGALRLSGVDSGEPGDGVILGNPQDHALDFGSDSFTMAIWVRLNGEDESIVSKGNQGFGSGYSLAVNQAGQVEVGVGASSSSQSEALRFRTTDSVNDGQWHHVAIVIDRVNSTGMIYVDGQMRDLQKINGTLGNVDPQNPKVIDFSGALNLSASAVSAPLVLGSLNGQAKFLQGDIDDFRLYRGALGSGEIQGIFIGEDSDSNGLPDEWEQQFFNTIGISLNGDADADGLNNRDEYLAGTNPLVRDSDGDTLSDGMEVALGLNPNASDSNGNGVADNVELDNGGSPWQPGPAPTPLPGPTTNPPHPAEPLPTPPDYVAPEGCDILVKTKSVSLPKYGFATFQRLDPEKCYLTQLTVDYQTPTPSAREHPYQQVSAVTKIDPQTGESTYSTSYPGVSPDMICSAPNTEAVSTLRISHTGNDDPGNFILLSEENTTDMLIANAMELLGDFGDAGRMALRSAVDEFVTGTPFAYRNLHDDEKTFDYQKAQFKFRWDESIPAAERVATTFLVVFTPEKEGEQPEVIRTITSEPSNPEKLFVIDPETEKPGKDGTYTLRRFEIETASIRGGEFVVDVPDLNRGDAVTLDLIICRQGSTTEEVVLKTLSSQAPGKVTIKLDEIMDQDTSPLDELDARRLDRVKARLRTGRIDVKSRDKKLDVYAVEVLAKRIISNYFSPTWSGTWGGAVYNKGVFDPDNYPQSLHTVSIHANLLNSMDPRNEGLAMDGNTVIRWRARSYVSGFERVTTDGDNLIPNDTDKEKSDFGYICFPDINQDNASSPSVALLRKTSVAVRTNADRLTYDDEVYIPRFSVRTVDDTGELHKNKDQIDVWRGQGDDTLRSEVNAWDNPRRTCLKIIKP